MNKLTINEYGSVIDSSGKTFLLNGVAIPCGNADKQAALNTKEMVERYNSHDKLTADNAALVEALEGLKSKLRELEQNELESLELDDIECNEIEILKAENQALRNELETANTEIERLRLLYKDTAIALVLKGGKVDAKSTHKVINKIKADAICDLADNYVNGPITAELTIEYIYEYANKLGKDND